MFELDVNQHHQLQLNIKVNHKLDKMLANLSPDVPWGERKLAAQKLGNLRDPEALPWLIYALPSDPFWMVRCAIIQALVMIGEPDALPVLREIAARDYFQVVRSHALKAIEKLSRGGKAVMM